MTQAVTAAQNFPADLPTFACEIKPIRRSSLKIAKANPERFAKLCLVWIADECVMRIWPVGYEERKTPCRNTYCLPKKVSRMAFSEGYDMNYRCRYKVSADGVTMVIDGEYLEGEPKGVTGKKTKIEHRKMLNKLVSRVGYEPIVIEGRAKALIDLETFLKIGADYEQ